MGNQKKVNDTDYLDNSTHRTVVDDGLAIRQKGGLKDLVFSRCVT